MRAGLLPLLAQVALAIWSVDGSPTSSNMMAGAPEAWDSSLYLEYAHPEPRMGSAFMPRSTVSEVEEELLGAVFGPAEQQPVRAYNRHPLVTPVEPGVNPQLRKRVNQVPVEDYFYPPSAWFDISNVTTIAMLAKVTVQRMQTWLTHGVYQWTPWWQTPVMGLAYVDLDLALGNEVNRLVATDLLTSNDNKTYMIDKYIDDQSWWGIFALRGYEAYGNATWLQSAQIIAANNSRYWDNTCGGGVLWLTYRPMIKNTVTNALHFSLLTRLYRHTGNVSYYNEAMQTLNWWLGWAFEPSTGRVYDTITGPSCNVSGLQTYSYNSGIILYGLADLYYVTGNTRLLDLGRTIAYAGIRDYTDEATGILSESCEHDPQPSATLPPGCQQDQLAFKGIFMLGLSYLYVARPDSNIYNFVNTQIMSVVFNNVDSSWLFGEWWGGPWNETTAGPKTQLSTICLVAAAATINVDFLSKAQSNLSVVSNAASWTPVPVPSASQTGDTSDAGSTDRATSAGARQAGTPLALPWVALTGVVGGLAAVALLAVP